MRLKETRELFERELDYPTDRETAVDAVGDAEIEAPDGGEVTVAEVLDRSDAAEFSSPEELHATVTNFVGDAFIGRKHYDDRGGQYQSDRQDGQESF